MTSRTKREYLREVAADTNRWSGLKLTESERRLAFLGWHERGYLPHYDFPGLVQFVTFWLADLMPASRRSEWEHLLAIGDVCEKRTKLEECLDRGVGECWLRQHKTALLTETVLRFEHLKSYELLAWCVMPNHVHLLVQVWETSLWKIIHNWKVHITRETRKLPRQERRAPVWPEPCCNPNEPGGCSALRSFWQREYWDTFMRNEEQEKTAIRYIKSNPVKAKLCRAAEERKFCSARFRDESWKLALPDSKRVNLKGR